MRSYFLIASNLAMISVALAMTYGNRYQRRKHHADRSHYSAKTRQISCFAQPPCQNEVGRAGRSKSATLSRPRIKRNNSNAPAIDQHLLKSSRQTPKKQRVQFVPWAGKRGMLPHQYYSGSLDYEDYCRWLQAPLNTTASVPTANVDNYFSTLPSASISTARETTACTDQIKIPNVSPRHLKPIYIDEHIIVVDKPSGVLSVPGPRRHECAASLAYRYFGKSNNGLENTNSVPIIHGESEVWQPLTAADNKQLDTMVVHRLDRDTSGVLMFARNDNALKQLHNDFKDKRRQRVNKKYVALVCGHWKGQTSSSGDIAIDEGEIDLPLVRDAEHPPFMRVATVETTLYQQQLKQQARMKEEQAHEDDPKKVQSDTQKRRQDSGYLRMIGKDAKASLTTYRILSYEYLIENFHREDGGDTEGIDTSPRLLPVTRVELTPVTGRTHQLRVHCAAVGHPIVGDGIYGHLGEGSPHGGLKSDKEIDEVSLDVQRRIYNYWNRRHQDPSYEKRQHQLMKKESGGIDGECLLCLHAHQLAIFHPLTESPIMFECAPKF